MVEDLLRACGGIAQIAAHRRRRDHRDALLVGAADFRRSRCEAHFGDRGERHRTIRSGVYHQVAHFLDGSRTCIDAANQHVDLFFLQAVTRGHVTAHVGYHAIRDVAHREPELRGAFLVEQNLDFRMAPFDAGADVLEGAAGFHACAHRARRDTEALEIVARENHFDGRGEREQRRPREFVLRAGDAREPCAQLLNGRFFAVLVDGRAQLHIQVAGVFAGIDRVRVQAIASAGHRIGALQIGQRGCRVVNDLYLGVGGLERGARRQAHLHGEFALRELWNQLGPETRQDQRGGGEHAEGGE